MARIKQPEMTMKEKLSALLALVSLAMCVRTTSAQDTRKVTEPTIPPVCRSLPAVLAVPGGAMADADEGKLDTERIQEAINACEPGKAVELKANDGKDAFLSGPIELKAGVTLLVGKGVTLFGSRDARLYEVSPGSCGLVNESGRGCRPLIHVKDAPHAAVMGDGIIDGRGGSKLLGRNVSWWDLAEEARRAGHQNCPRIIVAEHADDFTLYRVTLHNSPNFHVVVSGTNGFTAWGVKIFSPGRGARNADGIDPISSSNVSILYSYIHAGDDNVALKASASGPVKHVTIAHNHFYAGHGMSIGSETQGGVSDVNVHDLTIDGADNGLRIKSNSTRGGLVERVTYSDVCIRNVEYPIVIDPFYSTERGTKPPDFRDLAFRNVRILTPGRIRLKGQDAQHLSYARFDGVMMTDSAPKNIEASFFRLTSGPGEVNIVPAGEDVAIAKVKGERSVQSCEGVFVPYPEPLRAKE